MGEEYGDSAPEGRVVPPGGVAGARRRADAAGARTESGRRRLRDLADGERRISDDADPPMDGRGHEWTAHAQDQAARMHDSAAALHDQAAALGIGDEQEHRQRAERHRAAARSNRPGAHTDG